MTQLKTHVESSEPPHLLQTPHINFDALKQHVIGTLKADLITFLADANLPSPLYDACLYAVMGEGKRARPLLVASSFLTVTLKRNFTLGKPLVDSAAVYHLNGACRRAMLSVELLHAYSLIHDDLPCMDDDDLRRGRPTCHIAFDEATALLAGDVLQTLAFEVLTADITGFDPISSAHSLALLQIFSPRARRMVIGQALDVQAENKRVSQTELEAIHQDKTGALIEAAVLMGAVCGDKSQDKQLDALAVFAASLGLAFQVQDDILDMTATTDTLGKPAGSDEKLDKSTYVKLMGVDDAKRYAKSLFDKAHAAIVPFYGEDTPLNVLAEWLRLRQK